MDIFGKSERFLMNVYDRKKIVFKKGKGIYLYDFNNRKYLDFVSGIGVCILGHSHPRIVKVIKSQAERLLHTSNLYHIYWQTRLAEELVKKTFDSKVFFSNSGAEANECAIKLSRIWGKKNKNGAYKIITFKNSFHGRTLATLTATGQKKYQKGFSPLVSGFNYAKFNDIESVKKIISKDTVAIMLEPIQSEAGVIPAEKDFLKKLQQLCNKNKILLIFDEVQTGLGKTGKLFAYQFYNVIPDILTTAKGLCNGLPIGVTIAKKNIGIVFEYGMHASTFGGNPLVCAVGCKVLEILNKKFLENLQRKGNYFKTKLLELKKIYPEKISDVRGYGLILAIEFKKPIDGIQEKALNNGLLINVVHKKIIRFLPPFIVTENEIDYVIDILKKILK